MKGNRFRYKVWCKYHNRWEKHPVFLSPTGELWHFRDGKLSLVGKPGSHIIVFSTGHLDKNEKEMFDGDIVKHLVWDSYGTGLPNDNFQEDCISEVFWNQELGQWSARECLDKDVDIELVDLDKPEVIGNVYDNPELTERYG